MHVELGSLRSVISLHIDSDRDSRGADDEYLDCVLKMGHVTALHNSGHVP